MATKQKVPKEIYVTAKMRRKSSYDPTSCEWTHGDEYPFAFIHPHEPTKKLDVKRKKTQLQWAYGSYEIKEDIIICKTNVWGNGVVTATHEPAKYQPKVFTNEPLTGFEIFEVATRFSTNNKVFRVKDPRGFVTEITAKSLLGIILDGSIINGVIKEPCVWHANKNLVICTQ